MKFFEIYNILNSCEKKKFLIINFFLIFNIFLELLSLGAVLPFIAAILDFQSSNILNKFFNFFNFNESKELIVYMTLILFLIYTLKNIAVYLFNVYLHKFVTDVKIRLTQIIYQNYLTKEYSFHLKTKTSHLISDLTIEISVFITSYLMPYLIILSEGILAIAVIVTIFLLSPNYIIFFTVILLFLVIIFINIIKKYLKNLGSKRQIYSRNFINDLTVSFVNIKESIIYNSKNLFYKNLKKNSANLFNTEFKNMNILVLPKYLLEVIGVIFVCSLIIFLTKNNYSKEESFLILSLLAAVVIRFIPLVNKLVAAFQKIKFGKQAFKKVKSNCEEILQKDTLDFENSITINDNKFKHVQLKSINLKDIDFEYSKKQKILNKLNLNINFGEMVGINGESGSGKTTLVNILIGLIKQTNGKKLLNNKFDYHFSDLYNMGVAYASNNPNLIDASIEENIIYGREHDFNKLDKAIEISNLRKLASELKGNGIGENGNNISEGQKQRIGIARSIYFNPKIIIFDEATNGLDEKNEGEILKKLKEQVIFDKKIFIIISHKSVTMDFCDKVFNINDLF